MGALLPLGPCGSVGADWGNFISCPLTKGSKDYNKGRPYIKGPCRAPGSVAREALLVLRRLVEIQYKGMLPMDLDH